MARDRQIPGYITPHLGIRSGIQVLTQEYEGLQGQNHCIEEAGWISGTAYNAQSSSPSCRLIQLVEEFTS